MNKQEAIKIAKKDFKDLVIYFNVTRPQIVGKNYFKDGKFNIDVFRKQINFLNTWEKKTRIEKNKLSKLYSQYSATFNYVFGIPSELVATVLGFYRDNDGKKCRVLLDEVLDNNLITVVNSGKKFNRSKDGNYTVKCWWNKKYLFTNEKYWFKLMSEKKYMSIETFGSDRLIDIIFTWIKNSKNTATTATTATTTEESEDKNTTIEENNNNNNKNEDKEMVSNDVKKDLAGKAIRVLLKSGIINPETAVQWMKDFVYRSRENKFTIDEAMVEYNSNKTEDNDKNKVIDSVLKYLSDMGMTQHDGIYIMTEYLKTK